MNDVNTDERKEWTGVYVDLWTYVWGHPMMPRVARTAQTMYASVEAMANDGLEKGGPIHGQLLDGTNVILIVESDRSQDFRWATAYWLVNLDAGDRADLAAKITNAQWTIHQQVFTNQRKDKVRQGNVRKLENKGQLAAIGLINLARELSYYAVPVDPALHAMVKDLMLPGAEDAYAATQ